MTRNELDSRLATAVAKARIIIMNQAPYRTGNLRMSIRTEQIGSGYSIYVDTNQAPYMVHTEEAWGSKEKTNPNEGWFEDAIELVFQLIRIELGGVGYETTDLLDKEGE